MEKLFLIAALALAAMASAFAGPNDLQLMQRNSADTANLLRTIASPATDGLVYFNKTTLLPAYLTLGTGLSISSGTLSAAGAVGATGLAGPEGPQGVAGPTGATGPQGGQGPTGEAGATGPAGPTGATGATGSTGGQGIQGVQGTAGPTGATGPAGAQGAAGTPAPTTLRLRAQTNTAGVYTWTFPTAFGAAPVVNVSVEDTSGGGASWGHAITAISSTSVTVTLTKSTSVSILGISVLGIASTPQAYVHLAATAP